MFWDSIAGGLTVLTYWQTYVAAIEYLLVTMGPLILVAMIAAKNDTATGLVGCLSALAMPILQSFGIVVFLLTLSPIILGLAPDAAWSFPWNLAIEAPGVIAKLVLFLIVGGLALAFIPIIGHLQSLHSLLLGILTLGLVIGLIENTVPGIKAANISHWPGFWFVIGLLVIGGVLAKIGLLLAGVLIAAIDSDNQGYGQLVAYPVAAILGFLPVFIYGSWLGAQLRMAAGN